MDYFSSLGLCNYRIFIDTKLGEFLLSYTIVHYQQTVHCDDGILREGRHTQSLKKKWTILDVLQC